MVPFTFQLLAVFGLAAPGLALLIGFFYGETPNDLGGSTGISTTPPPPTAFVSLGTVFLASLVAHALTLAAILLLDHVVQIAIPGWPGVDPYAKLLSIGAGTPPTTPELLVGAVIVLTQVAMGLIIGRRLPLMVLSGAIPLTGVYGWTAPFARAARDPSKVVVSMAILKANAKDGRLLAYEGALDTMRLDGDLSIKLLVLKPANRLVLSLAPSPNDSQAGSEVGPAAWPPRQSSGSVLELLRESVPSITLAGAEIFSSSFDILDFQGQENAGAPPNIDKPANRLLKLAIAGFFVAPLVLLANALPATGLLEGSYVAAELPFVLVGFAITALAAWLLSQSRPAFGNEWLSAITLWSGLGMLMALCLRRSLAPEIVGLLGTITPSSAPRR